MVSVDVFCSVSEGDTVNDGDELPDGDSVLDPDRDDDADGLVVLLLECDAVAELDGDSLLETVSDGDPVVEEE